jgi:branched-subunit amino acid aminotransferase/4-amino-4-deoxychorismate lyase
MLLHAAESFLASTTREVQPLGGVEEHRFGEPGEATRQAAAALREHVESELAAT